MPDGNGTRSEGESKGSSVLDYELTKGDNYTHPAKPQNVRLEVSQSGMGDGDLRILQARYKAIGNSWDAITAKHQALTKKHNAHKAMFDSSNAQIGAAASLTKAATSWQKFQSSVVEHRVARNETRTKVAGMATDIEIQNVELQKKLETLEIKKLELKELMSTNQGKRQILDAEVIAAKIEGIDLKLSLPELQQNIAGLIAPPDLELII